MHSSCKCYFIIITTQRRMQFLHAPSLRIDIITNENLLSYHRRGISFTNNLIRGTVNIPDSGFSILR